MIELIIALIIELIIERITELIIELIIGLMIEMSAKLDVLYERNFSRLFLSGITFLSLLFFENCSRKHT